MTAARGDAPPADLLDEAERMGVDQLRELQLQRLQWTLRHAYENVPHYRRAFDAAGVHPDDRRDRAAAAVVEAVKDTIGASVEVLCVEPGTLARSAGKIQRVIDHRS